MITSIQIHEDTKRQLTRLKSEKESYEDVVRKLMVFYKHKNKQETLVLRDAYREIAQESEDINKEFQHADTPWPKW